MNTVDIRRRIAALDADIRFAEAKAVRLAHSTETRRKTLAQLRAMLAQIERGAAHARHAID